MERYAQLRLPGDWGDDWYTAPITDLTSCITVALGKNERGRSCQRKRTTEVLGLAKVERAAAPLPSAMKYRVAEIWEANREIEIANDRMLRMRRNKSGKHRLNGLAKYQTIAKTLKTTVDEVRYVLSQN